MMLLGMEVRMMGQYFSESSSFFTLFILFRNRYDDVYFQNVWKKSLTVHNTLVINLKSFSFTQFQNAFLDV